MMRIVKVALLTCVAAGLSSVSFAQGAPAPGQGAGAGAGAGAGGGQCQMLDPEYQVYNNANTQTDPKAKAAGFEAYLNQFPNSCMKKDVLDTLAKTYATIPDIPKAIHAADQILQLDPNNFAAIGYEVYLHTAAASAITDPDPKAKLPELDQAASYAQKGLAAPKPAGVSDADFNTGKENAYPLFYRAIAYDALTKGDFPTAIDNYKKELAFIQGDPKLAPQLKTWSDPLLDSYYLAVAYYKSQTPDYLDCAFYATRADGLAPANVKANTSQLSKYCYHQYHGQNDDQYPTLTQIAQANLDPPANLGTTITPKPTPAQIIAGILQSTPVDQLATSDKEYILQNGTPDQVQQVWDSMKGKSFQFPDMVVVSSTPQQIQVASPAAVVPGQTPTADFTFNMAPPEELPAKATLAQKKAYEKKQADIAAAIAPGKTVTLSGTFDSYTPKPFMITLTDGAVVLPEAEKPKPAAHAPVHHTTPHKAK